MTAFSPPRPDLQPRLAVVVDTEEEFDWRQPFARENRGVTAIPAQTRAHELFEPLGVVPTYVVDYPVIADQAAARLFRGFKAEGRADIGAHLHPWVTPPHDEDVTRRNSYGCNLPPELERAKIVTLTDAIGEAMGERPTIFKAGRHGFGTNTRRVLTDLGYRIDCSCVPYTSFAIDGGPVFYGQPDQPFWLDRDRRLLEIPVTNAFFGGAAALGPRMQPLFDSKRAARLRVPGLLARSGLLTRARLTPEGVSADDQCRLLDAMVARGLTTFTMVYHSPSLVPGHTPYVRTEEELARFLATIDTVLRYFRDRLGGRFTTLAGIHADSSATLAVGSGAARAYRAHAIEPVGATR
jgi:peptidoglycan/xylan/chitin deacetylase (PgdA/CDA1 family)